MLPTPTAGPCPGHWTADLRPGTQVQRCPSAGRRPENGSPTAVLANQQEPTAAQRGPRAAALTAPTGRIVCGLALPGQSAWAPALRESRQSQSGSSSLGAEPAKRIQNFTWRHKEPRGASGPRAAEAAAAKLRQGAALPHGGPGPEHGATAGFRTPRLGGWGLRQDTKHDATVTAAGGCPEQRGALRAWATECAGRPRAPPTRGFPGGGRARQLRERKTGWRVCSAPPKGSRKTARGGPRDPWSAHARASGARAQGPPATGAGVVLVAREPRARGARCCLEAGKGVRARGHAAPAASRRSPAGAGPGPGPQPHTRPRSGTCRRVT